MVGASSVTTEEYSELKKKFIDSLLASSRNEMELLKQSLFVFEEQINSKRTSSTIKSLLDLVKLLEKRDELSPTNVAIFKLWADSFQCPNGRSLIEQYEKLHDLSLSNSTCLQCKLVIPHPKLRNIPESKPAEKSKEEQAPAPKKGNDLRKAFDLIAPCIGMSWRDLARGLDLYEYDIEEIEETKRRLVDMSYEVFKRWTQNDGDKATVNKLLLVLSSIRRKDLHDKLLQAS